MTDQSAITPPGEPRHRQERELEALCTRSSERINGAVQKAQAAGLTQPPPSTLVRAARIEARLIEVRKKRRDKKVSSAVADAVSNPELATQAVPIAALSPTPSELLSLRPGEAVNADTGEITTPTLALAESDSAVPSPGQDEDVVLEIDESLAIDLADLVGEEHLQQEDDKPQGENP